MANNRSDLFVFVTVRRSGEPSRRRRGAVLETDRRPRRRQQRRRQGKVKDVFRGPAPDAFFCRPRPPLLLRLVL